MNLAKTAIEILAALKEKARDVPVPERDNIYQGTTNLIVPFPRLPENETRLLSQFLSENTDHRQCLVTEVEGKSELTFIWNGSVKKMREQLEQSSENLSNAVDALKSGWKIFISPEGARTLELEYPKNVNLNAVFEKHLKLDRPNQDIDAEVRREWKEAGKTFSWNEVASEVNRRQTIPTCKRDEFGVSIPYKEKDLETLFGMDMQERSKIKIGGGATDSGLPIPVAHIQLAERTEAWRKGHNFIRLQDNASNRTFLKESLGVEIERIPEVHESDRMKQRDETLAVETENLVAARGVINKGVLLYQNAYDKHLLFADKGEAANALRQLKSKTLIAEDSKVSAYTGKRYTDGDVSEVTVHGFEVSTDVSKVVDEKNRVPLSKDNHRHAIRTRVADAADLLQSLQKERSGGRGAA